MTFEASEYDNTKNVLVFLDIQSDSTPPAGPSNFFEKIASKGYSITKNTYISIKPTRTSGNTCFLDNFSNILEC